MVKKVARNKKKPVFTGSNTHSTSASRRHNTGKHRVDRRSGSKYSFVYRDETRLLKLALFIFALSPIVHGIFSFIHFDDTGPYGMLFFNANFTYLIFGALTLAAFFGSQSLATIAGERARYMTGYVFVDTGEFGGIGEVLWKILLFTGLVLGVQLIFGLLARFIQYDVLAIEYYFFFVTVGITEELICRLFLLNLFEYQIGKINKTVAPHIAVFISGLIFGLIHIFVYGEDILLMISVTVGGIVLGYAYVTTDNILTPIFAHMINNLVGAILLKPQTVIESFLFIMPFTTSHQASFSILFYLAIVPVLAFIKRKKEKPMETIENVIDDEPVDKKKRAASIIITVAIIAFFLCVGFVLDIFRPTNWFGI